LGAQIFGHQVWQPKATKTFWSPRMAIECDQKLVTNFQALPKIIWAIIFFLLATINYFFNCWINGHYQLDN